MQKNAWMALAVLGGTLRHNIIRAFVAPFILKSCCTKFLKGGTKEHKGLTRVFFWHAKTRRRKEKCCYWGACADFQTFRPPTSDFWLSDLDKLLHKVSRRGTKSLKALTRVFFWHAKTRRRKEKCCNWGVCADFQTFRPPTSDLWLLTFRLSDLQTFRLSDPQHWLWCPPMNTDNFHYLERGLFTNGEVWASWRKWVFCPLASDDAACCLRWIAKRYKKNESCDGRWRGVRMALLWFLWIWL